MGPRDKPEDDKLQWFAMAVPEGVKGITRNSAIPPVYPRRRPC